MSSGRLVLFSGESEHFFFGQKCGSENKKKIADQKIDQLKNSAIKNIKDASVKIAILSTSKIIQTSIDKTKLDTVFKVRKKNFSLKL